MSRSVRLASITAVLLLSSLATARPPPVDHDDEDDEVTTHEERSRRRRPQDEDKAKLDEPAPWRLEGGIGVRFGSFLVNNIDTTNTIKAGHLDGGLRNGRLLLNLEYQLASIQLPATVTDEIAARGVFAIGNGRALVHRTGANARYSFGRTGESDIGSDLWIEGGVGLQHVRWDSGGRWTRPDFALGLGAAMWGSGKERHGGLSLGLRVNLARREDTANAPVACGGPCDAPTRPTGWDRSFLFDVTVMFGR